MVVVSSCREMLVSPATSATLVLCCQHVMAGNYRDCRVNWRKVGMTSNHHALYVLGFTHATMAGTKGCEIARWSESKNRSQFGLRSATSTP